MTESDTLNDALDTLTESVGSMFESFVASLPKLAIAVVLLVITSILASILKRFVLSAAAKLKINVSLKSLFAQFAYLGVFFAGLMVVAGLLFPGFGFGQLVATAGLASIAIGFAFQDIFENFFAGILILWRFPFDKGDFIVIPAEGVDGQIEEVEIRMTRVRQTSGELVLVPNATIYKSVVQVLTNKPIRRVTVMCGIAYGESVGEGRQVIRAAVESCETVNRDKPIQIFANGFGASSIDFEVTWWTGARPVDIRQSRDEVIEAVKKGLDDANIEIPYPYMTLTMSKNEPDIIDAVRGRASARPGE